MSVTCKARAAVVAAVLLVASTSCGDDAPASLRPAAASSPAGTTRFFCDVTAASGPVRFAVDLPTGFSARGGAASGCAWAMTVRVGERRERYDADVVVTVSATGSGDPLQDEYDEQKVDSVDDGAPDGDDAIYDLELDEDVPVFGTTIGDRLSYLCFCDGQGNLERSAQAGGVILTWSSVSELTKETGIQLDQALAGAGTVAD